MGLAEVFAARLRQARDLAANRQLDTSPPTPVRTDHLVHLGSWTNPVDGVKAGQSSTDEALSGTPKSNLPDDHGNPPIARTRWH